MYREWNNCYTYWNTFQDQKIVLTQQVKRIYPHHFFKTQHLWRYFQAAMVYICWGSLQLQIHIWAFTLLLLSHFSCVRLCNPIDRSPPGSPVPGILQARTLEWVAISFSNIWPYQKQNTNKNNKRLTLLNTYIWKIEAYNWPQANLRNLISIKTWIQPFT